MGKPKTNLKKSPEKTDAFADLKALKIKRNPTEDRLIRNRDRAAAGSKKKSR